MKKEDFEYVEKPTEKQMARINDRMLQKFGELSIAEAIAMENDYLKHIVKKTIKALQDDPCSLIIDYTAETASVTEEEAWAGVKSGKYEAVNVVDGVYYPVIRQARFRVNAPTGGELKKVPETDYFRFQSQVVSNGIDPLRQKLKLSIEKSDN